MSQLSRPELMALGRQWLEHAPEAKGGGHLKGFRGPVGFVCDGCAGRIIGRGCNLRMLATEPVYPDQPGDTCALCGKADQPKDNSKAQENAAAVKHAYDPAKGRWGK